MAQNVKIAGASYEDVPAVVLATTDGGTATFVDATEARPRLPWAIVDSTSTSTVFTATVDGITELKSGVCCILWNNKVTSASGCTLNINGLGAKPIYMTNAAATRVTTQFAINYTFGFIYNETRVSGGCWDLVYLFNTNDNTLAYNIRRGNGTYKSLTALYRYQILLTYSDTQLLPVNAVSNNTGTTKALTTEEFDPFGDIYYYGSTTTVSAGANIGVTYLYAQYASADLRYSFNIGKTLTAHKSVYLVAVPQANGRARLHSSPIAQDLPTTEDGLIYIRLGRAYSTYQIQLDQNKPIYYYKDDAVRLWTNAVETAAPSGGICYGSSDKR
ncbi:MAG: hypothetical protein IJV41_12265 [Oscillospiraceae bacterium]|nr:hypothetical protein [Oscillospiraceae bacterium]